MTKLASTCRGFSGVMNEHAAQVHGVAGYSRMGDTMMPEPDWLVLEISGWLEAQR